MSVNIDNDVVDVIGCVPLFYENTEERKFVSSQGEISGTTSTEGEDIPSGKQLGKFMQHSLNWGRKDYV